MTKERFSETGDDIGAVPLESPNPQICFDGKEWTNKRRRIPGVVRCHS